MQKICAWEIVEKNANLAGQRVGIQTVRRRLREILFLDWDIGLLASSRDPNLWAGIYFVLDCGLLVFFKYSTHKP
jgi:hypothetical protein